MAITPQTDIYLLKCPIEADNRNQINFANATAQYNYFASLPKLVIDNCTYQRKDDVMRLPYHIDDIINYNYVMYRNEAYGNKWFYAFITNMEYSSDHMTFVTIKTDVFQTWQFDLSYKKSFVEREHVNSDTIGEHTIPENFELGDYVTNEGFNHVVADPSTNSTICMQVSSIYLTRDNYDPVTMPSNERMYNGIPQGCQMYGFALTTADLTLMYEIIGLYDTYGKGDAILSLFIVPTTATTWETGTISGGVYNGVEVSMPATSKVLNSYATQTPPQVGTTINGYTPKNKKLFTYPYNCLYLSNNNGTDVIYHYEDFISNAPAFNQYMAVDQGGSVYIAPTNSKKNVTSGTGDCWNEGISLGKFPQVSWLSDYYLNWQAKNATNIQVQTTLDALSWGGSMVSGMIGGILGADYSRPEQINSAYGASNAGFGMASSTISLASSVANTMQQIRQAKMTPEQAKGQINAGSIGYSNSEIGYRFNRMSIKAEYAQIIDEYWTAYGYKVNSFKIPNITGRTYWNYVKTIGANIEGNIPQGDMDEIKSLFDRGITIWHDTAHYLDYTQNNTIV